MLTSRKSENFGRSVGIGPNSFVWVVAAPQVALQVRPVQRSQRWLCLHAEFAAAVTQLYAICTFLAAKLGSASQPGAKATGKFNFRAKETLDLSQMARRPGPCCTALDSRQILTAAQKTCVSNRDPKARTVGPSRRRRPSAAFFGRNSSEKRRKVEKSEADSSPTHAQFNDVITCGHSPHAVSDFGEV
jgi:hypothetical protein